MLALGGLASAQSEPTGGQRAARPTTPTAVVPATRAPKSRYERDESEREDKLTGGTIETAEFVAGEPDIKITVDVPAFRLTLWQAGKEVKVYKIGVGMKKYPLAIGERKIEQIIWNPDWIPPDSDWVGEHSGVSVGEVIKASDPRNPIGKVKMPLGDGYLIHEAHGVGDWGNLVSHGCVRMVRADLYDLAEKIVAARSLPVSAKKIANAKRTKKMLVAHLDEPLPIDINYDTQVVEGGVLHLYADVYGRGTNTVEQLRAELADYGVEPSSIGTATLKKLLSLPTRQRQYVVSLDSIKEGRALEDGHFVPVIPSATTKKTLAKKTARPA
ncbi:MAG: L,D-transpeptidase ErfK/SrfK [Acidobacteriota bacterium]|nr:L,D-transpeptidase ErfK/SrfK [Acidobacteriota bacterium]